MIRTLLKAIADWASKEDEREDEDVNISIPPAIFIRLVDCSQDCIFVYVQIDDPDAGVERVIPGVILDNKLFVADEPGAYLEINSSMYREYSELADEQIHKMIIKANECGSYII